MNHQDVRNQYLQVHGIDPVEIEVGAAFDAWDAIPTAPCVDCKRITANHHEGMCLCLGCERLGCDDDEPRCNAATHGRRCSTCTCEDSRDE